MKIKRVILVGGNLSGQCFTEENNSKDFMDNFSNSFEVSCVYNMDGCDYKPDKIENGCLTLKAPFIN